VHIACQYLAGGALDFNNCQRGGPPACTSIVIVIASAKAVDDPISENRRGASGMRWLLYRSEPMREVNNH
jgi:hypothetical protein